MINMDDIWEGKARELQDRLKKDYAAGHDISAVDAEKVSLLEKTAEKVRRDH